MSAPDSHTSTVLWPTKSRLEGCDIPLMMEMSLLYGAKGSSGFVNV